MFRVRQPLRVPFAVAFMLVASSSCTSILGVEDLYEEPRPGSGSGGSPELGGESSGGDGQSGNTNGGKAPKGGSPGRSGAPGAGGDENSGGEPAAGTAGLAGAGGSPSEQGGAPSAGAPDVPPGGSANEGGGGGTPVEDGTVHGTVIDLFGHRVPNASVSIGETTVTTDSDGQFEIESVPERYDVRLIVTPLVNNSERTAHWAYLGLSRRDPTLQVYRGLESHSADVHVQISNGVFDNAHETGIAVASPNGASSMSLSSSEITYLGGFSWYGPRTTQGKAHALLWSVDTDELPVAYDAFAELAITADGSGVDTEVPITFPTTPPEAGSVSGTVAAANSQSRTNYAFVRFTSNGVIPVVEDNAGPDTFSYLVPSIAGSVITMAASTGDSWGPFAIAHKEAAPGQTDVTLTIPSAPVLTQPPPDAQDVDTTTTFQWTTSAKVSLLWIEDVDFYRSTYVLTEGQQVTLPSFAGGSPLRSGGAQVWKVETHGSWDSIDAATGSTGFLDSFGARLDEPVGPRRGAGSMTLSAGRGFKAR